MPRCDSSVRYGDVSARYNEILGFKRELVSVRAATQHLVRNLIFHIAAKTTSGPAHRGGEPDLDVIPGVIPGKVRG